MNDLSEIVAHKDYYGNTESLEYHVNDMYSRMRTYLPEWAYNHAYALCLFHDIGKCRPEWQDKILHHPDNRVEHSKYGASTYFSYTGDEYISYLIERHHSTLKNISKLKKNDKNVLDINVTYDYDVDTPYRQTVKNGLDMFFYLKFLNSAFIDADWSSTGHVEEHQYDFDDLHDRFFNLYNNKFSASPTNKINTFRKDIFNKCCDAGKIDESVFKLTVPTGAGKTLSSMGFALKHLKNHGKKRIIYLIPYTSIIDQTAKVFIEYFGKENVLVHHSNNEYTGDEEKRSWRWDAPIIITTPNQFFESIFTNRRNKVRKIHQIIDSVIIIDEVQAIPQSIIQPCLESLNYISSGLNSSILFTTATQPNFDTFFNSVYDIHDYNDRKLLFDHFKRVRVSHMGEYELRYKKALIITETKKDAYEFYNQCTFPNKYILTTLTTMTDRLKILKRVKDDLKNGVDVILFSTTLIEAGVDIDFPVVYRQVDNSYTTYPNIIQSAGRCNREGKLEYGKLILFGRNAFFYEDLTYDTIEKYFNDIDYHKNSGGNILDYCRQLNFEKAEIDYISNKNSITAYILNDTVERIINKNDNINRFDMKRIQKFGVTLNKTEQKMLDDDGILFEHNYLKCIPNAYYDNLTGVNCYGEKNEVCLIC